MLSPLKQPGEMSRLVFAVCSIPESCAAHRSGPRRRNRTLSSPSITQSPFTERKCLMADEPKTRRDFETALILRAWKDDAFRRELLSDPKAAIAKVAGRRLPDDVEVVVHEETAKTIHLCLPEKPATALRRGAELSDDDLGAVAAGATDSFGSLCGNSICVWGCTN